MCAHGGCLRVCKSVADALDRAGGMDPTEGRAAWQDTQPGRSA